MTKRQEFRVIEKYENFEVREYLPCVIAEIRVSADYASATTTAFRHLIKYISKGNRTETKIPMTAPVIAAQRADRVSDKEWFVSFVMPSGSRFGHLPHPSDPQVVLRELESETCVASSFRGRATAELSKKKTQELRTAAGKVNLSLSDETRICRFDPPFKPGFLQRNEIVIPVYLETS
jgi:hypothetical protein